MTATILPQSLVLIGAGKMGGAMLRGWLDLGVPAKCVTIIEPYPSDELAALCAATGASLTPAKPPQAPVALVLAIKPQTLDAGPWPRPAGCP